MTTTRVDRLPLDRRVTTLGDTAGQLPALFERRDIEPEAVTLMRRTGSLRSQDSVPNLIGVSTDGEDGKVWVDRDFDAEIGTAWTLFGTFRCPDSTLSSDSYQRIVSINDVVVYIKHKVATNRIVIEIRNEAGTLIVSSSEADLDVNRDLRFAVRRETAGNVAVNGWVVPAPGVTATVGADASAAHTFDDTINRLQVFGTAHSTLTAHYSGVILTNLLFYNADVFATTDYDAFANDLTPATSIASPGVATLLWQGKFSEGGSALTYTNDAAALVSGYLIPTKPDDYAPDGGDATEIHFGGQGVIEVPFYLDFDEYYWTSTNASARLEWCFQLEVTTPAILSAGTIFELQDLARLRIEESGGSYYLKTEFNNDSVSVTHTTALAGSTSYDVFVARDADNVYLKQDATELSATATNPIIFNYDKTLGFVIGDTVDIENAEPFGGRLGRFALHNVSTRSFQPKPTAVMYYDVDSLYGDEVLDRGPRSINGYLGVRSAAQSPFYREGAFPGGAYVAACGGYVISGSSPSFGYTGTLQKPLLKDAVVQREGNLGFLVSNNIAYVVDDLDSTFRPLGIPRPTTKVSCTPQGVGAIDGFVRYGYRYVTQDGTVGPVFQLDPCDATGGVNVLLGAETFDLPQDPAFGVSYGECEIGTVAADAVECFLIHDDDDSGGGDPTLLHIEKKDPGLTLEVAFRLPEIAAETEESVVDQGAHMPFGPLTWCADSAPKSFPWIGAQGQECCFQFSFRYFYDAAQVSSEYQTLFGVGARNQQYTTGSFGSKHWRLNHLVVSIQPPLDDVANTHSIVVCRDDPSGSSHRDNDLDHWDKDYNFISGNDYTVFVSRAGSLKGHAPGADLTVSIYDHTQASWKEWPHDATATQVGKTNFWGSQYTGDAKDEPMWGAMRREGSAINVKTRKRAAAGSSTFNFGYVNALYNGTTTNGIVGSVMYHGRMWRQDHPLTLLAEKGLERFGARTGALAKGLEIDVAFCPDSSQETLEGGWDFPNDLRVKFYAPNPTNAVTVLTDSGDQTVFLAYGFDNSITAASPDTHVTQSTDVIPMWAAYTSRNQGSLVIGTGKYVAFEVGVKKWHTASEVVTFDEFAGALDLKQWTWLTLYFNQILRVGVATSILDVWLERIFLDGNTGEWGELYNADLTQNGPGGKDKNSGVDAGQWTLMSVGGVPGIDSDFEVEIAEVRLWDGERYTAAGGGDGEEAFGPYLSTRIPPNIWDELHHYVRFAPLDLDDVDTPTTMDQHGVFAAQKNADAVDVYQGADIISGEDVEDNGSHYFIPFPTPPLDSIRGIQIFRSQVVPVTETYDNGKPNPNATTDAFKAALAAPLYFLTEIPDGKDFYFDAATDDLLGGKLDLTEGLIPTEPAGIFEWGGHLGIWVSDRPRIHFSAAPGSWESYPSALVYDLPLREHGQIQAAAELGARDARFSRALVLGKAWGLFLEGSPTEPKTSSLGGGVGAASSRCLVVEGGVAYAYNGTLWAISGDGAVTNIGQPVRDLLPPVANARLSVSGALSSLFVINETTGLALRFHLATQEWYVDDRYALSVTDVDGVDNWVHLTGYPSAGDASTYGDDIDSDTASSYTVSSYDNGTDTFVVSSATGLSLGQRITLSATQDPRERQVVTVASISGTTVTVTEDLALTATGPDVNGTTVTFDYVAYVGIGEWGTMLDTGPFLSLGFVDHADIGVLVGDDWYAMAESLDYLGDPTDRSGFDASESFPTAITNAGGSGASARWGVHTRQRAQRVIFWNPKPAANALAEIELNRTNRAPR